METYLMLFVYCDASIAPKNPGGHCCAGIVVKDSHGKVLHKSAYSFGEYPQITNNCGEHGAIWVALQYLIQAKLNHHEIRVHTDSQLVVRQLNYEYGCNEKLAQMRAITEKLAKHFPKVSYTWIPREENTEADAASRSLYK